MRKLVFAAMAGVFMLSSGFSPEDSKLNNVAEEDFSCECACLTIYIDGEGTPSIHRAYTRDKATCTSVTSGKGTYNDKDCQNTSGILNNQNSLTLQEASKC